MADKRYYWLKLQDDFFASKRIKKLRRIAGGDTYTITYLKMQLLAMKTGGVLEYTGLEKTFAEELALDLDEDADNVTVTVNFLLGCGLLETSDNREYFVPYAVMNTGSEGSSAKRVREFRERKALQCNADNVTQPLLHNGEKEIEIERELEEEIEGEKKEPPAAPPTPPPKEPEQEPERHKHGANGWVLLTDEQYAKLLSEFGPSELERCITYVDESAQITGNKNKWKDWYLVVRKCHREKWGVKVQKQAPAEQPKRRKSFAELAAEMGGEGV